jgi:hypothetical protein
MIVRELTKHQSRYIYIFETQLLMSKDKTLDISSEIYI